MTTRITRLALLSTASAAVFALPSGASAQSVTCSQTGTAVTCVNGATTVATGTTTGTVNAAVPGLRIDSAADQTTSLTATGPITVVAPSAVSPVTAVDLRSGGAITLTAPGVNVSTTGGSAADAVILDAAGNITASLGNVSTTGTNSFAVSLSSGGIVNLTTGNITTTGDDYSAGIIGDSTGNAQVTAGTLNVTGPGVFFSSGGNLVINTGAITTSGTGLGYRGIDATGATVSVTTGAISTTGSEADGVQISSTGAVTTAVGNITTLGGDSAGLFITGGTGNVQAGYGNISTSGGGASYPVLISTTSGNINLAGGNVSATGANQIGIELTSTSGAITGTTGSISATGAGSRGLVVNGGTGTTAGSGLVNLTVGAVTAANDGVVINNGADPITLAVGAVTTTEADAPAVSLASTGAITVTTGLLTTGSGTTTRNPNSPGLMIMGGAGAVNATVAGATTTGANSDAIAITSAGPITVTNTGTINVSGNNSIGIDVASTGGTGAINVTTGAVTSTAANAAADPAFSAVRVVATGAAPVNVVANGNISTTNGSAIWAQTAGAATVTVNQGVTVTGPTAVTLGGTTGNTLIVNGTIGSTTAGNPAFVLAVPGAPLSLTVGATGTINGPLAFTTGNDAFTNNRTAGFTQVGALAFGTGNDTFTNSTVFTQTAAIDFGDGNDTFTNTATGTFNHGGAITFGAGDDTVNNAGIFNLSSAAAVDFGANATATGDVFNNTGTLNLRDGAQTLANLETFNNTGGLIDLRDGAANDVLTIPGAYAATGNARLGIDVIGANNLLTADRLVIGGAVTGTTTVLATFGGTPVIDTTGALVVDTAGTTLAANAFVLGGVTNAGLINYSLETRGGDVFLVARPDEAVLDQLFVGRIANDIWYQSAEAYQAYAMSRRIDYGNERKGPVGIWAQLYGSKQRSGERNRQVTAFGTTLNSSNRFEQNERGAQVGLDFGVQNFIVGVTAGYEKAEGDTDFGTGIVAEGYNYGAYAQFGAQQGLYAGVLVKRDDYDIRLVNSPIGALASPDGRSTGIDGEVGFRFGDTGGLNFDLGAGLSYVRSKVDGYTFGNLGFEDESYTSTRGRLQARASFAGTLAPFIDAKVFREFGDENELTLRSGTTTSTIADGKRGTWARVEGGIGGGAGGGPLFSGWVDFGDVKGWGVRGGFRF